MLSIDPDDDDDDLPPKPPAETTEAGTSEGNEPGDEKKPEGEATDDKKITSPVSGKDKEEKPVRLHF